MGLAIVHSRARVGVHAPEVRVEVHLGGGLPSMSIVGLPEAAVREAKDRVRAAIHCAQFEFPARRITINLAPADLPKHGGRFDLAIALGILAASGQVSGEALDGWEFLGELALTGEIRAVDGVLAAALASGRAGRRLLRRRASSSSWARSIMRAVFMAGGSCGDEASIRGGGGWRRRRRARRAVGESRKRGAAVPAEYAPNPRYAGAMHSHPAAKKMPVEAAR